MEVIVKGEPKEIAAFVAEIQRRQGSVDAPLDVIKVAFRTAIDGTGQEEQTAS